MLRPYWRSNVNSGDGVVRQSIFKFELRASLFSSHTLRQSPRSSGTTRNDDGSLKRGHSVNDLQHF